LENAWKALQPHFAHRLGSAVSPEDCRAYAKARKLAGRAPSTIKTELEYLRACLVRRYGKGNVTMWLPPKSAPRDRWLSREEVDTLLTHIETPHVRLFVTLAITTGARMSAILSLRWDQVRLDARTPTVDFRAAGREQTNKRRVEVPLNKRAVTALREMRDAAQTDYVIEWAGEPVASVKKAIRLAAQRSGVPCSPHVFRHTAGVWLAHADQPMSKIAQFLGHTSTRVTEEVYARYSPSFMADSAAALEF
jgi:integrase